MLSPLPRQSLSQRVASELRALIQQGQWMEFLPGERTLSDRLRVSRPVLRQALQHLQSEGLILCEANKTRRIASAQKPPPPSGKRQVLIIVGNDQFPDISFRDPLVLSLGSALSRHSIAAEVHSHSAVPALWKKRLLTPEMTSILVSVPPATQRWFQKHDLPAIVAGCTYADIQLPSLDFDNRAAAFHAVGQFLRLGHRRIACLSPERPRAGDLETEEGFLNAFRQSPNKEAAPSLIRCPLDPLTLERKLKRLLSVAAPPTALFVCHAHLAVAALTLCHRLRIEVPQHLSLICRDSSPFLDYAFPSIACYELSTAVFLRQLLKLILSPPTTPIMKRLTPRYKPGSSLTKAP